MRTYFHPGDVVRVTTRRGTGLFRGEVPEGAQGVVRGIRQIETPLTPRGETVTAAVVYFPGVGEKLAGLGALELVRTGDAESERSMEILRERLAGDARSTALAAAQRRVADAHDELARATAALKELEAQQ
jgi:hypothetical protein